MSFVAGPIAWYVRDNAPTSTIGWSAVAAWHTPWSPTVGTLCRQAATPVVGNERVFICTISGAVGGAEPTWNITQGGITSDNAATWIECTGQPPVNDEPTFSRPTNASSTSGSKVLNFHSTANFQIGQYVIGTNIPNGTTVADVTATSVYLDTALSGTVANAATIKYGYVPFWSVAKVNSGSLITGMIILNTSLSRFFICTTASSSLGALEPTWNTSIGSTTTDGSAVWTCIAFTTVGFISDGGSVYSGPYAIWAAPFARLATATSWAGDATAKAIIWVADDHAETQSVAMSIDGPIIPYQIYCIDHTASLPVSSTNLKTTATVSTTNGNDLTIITQSAYYYGIIFQAGTGNNNASLIFQGVSDYTNIFQNCQFKCLTGGPYGELSKIQIDSMNCVWNNCIVTFASSAGLGFSITSGSSLTWRLGSTVGSLNLSTSPLFSGDQGIVNLIGVDIQSVKQIWQGNPSIISLSNCRISSTASIIASSEVTNVLSGSVCDNAGTNYRFFKAAYNGVQTTETSVVRTNGASNGITAISAKVVISIPVPFFGYNSTFQTLPIITWNALTASNLTYTVYGIAVTSTMPTNDDIWLEIEYLGSASNPLVSIATTGVANALDSSSLALTTDNSDWTSLVSVRSNSHFYNAGNAIKVNDAPFGMVFFCTVSGTSNSSEPVGYASAGDGATITDGGATFIAGMRFRLSLTLSAPQPQLIGDICAIVKVSATKLTSNYTFYLDPLVT